jgi:hypothetical protein
MIHNSNTKLNVKKLVDYFRFVFLKGSREVLGASGVLV